MLQLEEDSGRGRKTAVIKNKKGYLSVKDIMFSTRVDSVTRVAAADISDDLHLWS